MLEDGCGAEGSGAPVPSLPHTGVGETAPQSLAAVLTATWSGGRGRTQDLVCPVIAFPLVN